MVEYYAITLYLSSTVILLASYSNLQREERRGYSEGHM